jgi:hypothetical protein
MSSGWIKLHRSLVNWEWYDDLNTSRLFIHLLITANHKDNNWRGITIKRGSRLTSLDKLSSETSLSVSKIRTSIKKLILTNELASESHTQHTVFIIKNYDDYQGDDKQNDKRVTSESQASDKRIATNKNVKNENNEKNGKINKEIMPSKLDDASEIFEFWCITMDKKKSAFSPTRKKKVLDRIKEGYTIEEIKTAILNCSTTPHNMGNNENSKEYNDLELICRSPEKLEQFRDNPGSMKKQSKHSVITNSNIEAAKNFMNN